MEVVETVSWRWAMYMFTTSRIRSIRKRELCFAKVTFGQAMSKSPCILHYSDQQQVTNAASPGICRSGFSPAVQPGLTPEFTRPTLSDAQDILQNDAWRWWVADVSLPVRISRCVFSKATFKTETFVSTDSTSCERLTFLQSRQAISIINDV